MFSIMRTIRAFDVVFFPCVCFISPTWVIVTSLKYAGHEFRADWQQRLHHCSNLIVQAQQLFYLLRVLQRQYLSPARLSLCLSWWLIACINNLLAAGFAAS